MKKVSILLLLTVVLASFAFAIDGVGDFKANLEIGLDNVSGANEGDMVVSIEPSIKFSRAFGALGLSVTLADTVYIDTDSDADPAIGDELSFNITPSYTLAAGPGELGFSLGLQLNVPLTSDYPLGDSYGREGDALFFRIDPTISYGLDAGFGALAFSLGTDHLQISKIHGDTNEDYGLDALPLYLQAGVDLPFGLGIWLKPYLKLAINDEDGDTELAKFVFDIHYAITDQITAGVETTIPTYEDGIKKEGIEIIPYGEFGFGALGAYLKIDITSIASDRPALNDIMIKPIIGVSYSF
jgi:hypothetical protein